MVRICVVPPPIRFIVWIIGLGVDIGTPLLFARQLSVPFARIYSIYLSVSDRLQLLF